MSSDDDTLELVISSDDDSIPSFENLSISEVESPTIPIPKSTKNYTAQNVYCALANRYNTSVAVMKKIVVDIKNDIPKLVKARGVDEYEIYDVSIRNIVDELKTVITDADVIVASKKRVISSKDDIAKVQQQVKLYVMKILYPKYNFTDIIHEEVPYSKPPIHKDEEASTSKKDSACTNSCCICFEDVSVNKISKGDGLICPKCNVCYCYTCLIGQITSTRNLLVCSTKGCNTPLDEFVMYPYFTKSRILSFRPHNKECLVDIELSLLDATRQRVYTDGCFSRLGCSYVDLTGRMIPIGLKRRVVHKSVGVKLCGINGCPGFLNDRWICGICEAKRCRQCHAQSITAQHICSPEDLATVDAIRKDSCQCPKCGEYTSRIHGCNHMFCVMCKSSFNYVQGGVGTYLADSHNTNPEYQRYRRELRAQNTPSTQNASSQASSSEEFQIGVCQDECPVEAAIPSAVDIVNVMAMALCDRTKIAQVLHIHRMAGEGSEVNQYLETCSRSEENKDCEFYRELLILAKNGTKLPLDSYIEDPSIKSMYRRKPENKYITIVDYLHRIPGALSSCINPDGSYNEKIVLSQLKKRTLMIYREKQKNYHYRNLLLTFKVACGDILRNIVSFGNALHSIHLLRSKNTSQGSVEDIVTSLKAIELDILSHLSSFQGLKRYVNETFREIAIMLGYSADNVPGITDRFSFSKNLAKLAGDVHHNVDKHLIKETLEKYVCRFFDFVDLVKKFGVDGSNKMKLSCKGIIRFGDPAKLQDKYTSIKISDLNLSNNQLRSVDFGNGLKTSFTTINSLDLSSNPLGTITADMFAPLIYLQNLYLLDCGITHIEDGAFDSNIHLRLLTLDGNNIRDLHKFKFLPKSERGVQQLNVSRCRIPVLDMNFIPAYVAKFAARGSKITSVIPRTSVHTAMQDISLSSNIITKIDEKFVRSFINLKRLDLDACKINYIHPDAFIGLPVLGIIDLKDNNLTQIILSPERSLVDSHFNLNSFTNPITKRIYVKGNPMTKAANIFIDLAVVGIPGYLLTGNTFH